MTTPIYLHAAENLQLAALAEGAQTLNDVLIKAGQCPALMVSRDGHLVTHSLTTGQLVPLTVDSLATALRGECIPTKVESTTKDGVTTVKETPVPKLPRDLVRAYIDGGDWPGVPIIKQVAQAPVIRPDFTVRWEPGWDEETSCWVLPGLSEDRSLVGQDPRDFFNQFALTDRRQVADCLAAALTPMLSTAIDGALPGFVATASNPGSGKSALSEFIARLSGCEPDVTRWPGADELNKTVSAFVASDTPVVLFDNIKRAVDSPDLESLITARKTSYRAMRTHSTVTLTSNTVWHMTVNNASVSQDIQRRCIFVNLDPLSSPSPRAWDGTLEAWSKSNRAALVTAMCALIEAWRDCGAPDGSVIHPGFEQWSKAVSGILECAGIAGFWEARDDVLSDSVGTDSDDNQELLERIFTRMGKAEFTANQLWESVSDPFSPDVVLKSFLHDVTNAGYKLRSLKGSKDTYVLNSRRSNGTKWWVTCASVSAT